MGSLNLLDLVVCLAPVPAGQFVAALELYDRPTDT
jgi:hypothetical protein